MRRIGEAAAEKQQELEKDDESLEVEPPAESPVPESAQIDNNEDRTAPTGQRPEDKPDSDSKPSTRQSSPALSTSSHLRDLEDFDDVRAPSPADDRIDPLVGSEREDEENGQKEAESHRGGYRGGRGSARGRGRKAQGRGAAKAPTNPEQSVRRTSTRATVQAKRGLELVAGGLPSPPNRR